MEYSTLGGVAGKTVKFFVYGPTSADPAKAVLLNAADLDGHGPKFVPNLCVTCHGGDPLNSSVTRKNPPTPQQASLRFDANNESSGAHFREFDLASFRYSTGTHTDPKTNVPTDASTLAAFKRLNQFVLSTKPPRAISEIIGLWYHKTSPPYDSAAVPTGWSSHQDLYRDVVARSCRTCHVALSDRLDWSKYSNFKQNRPTIKAYVCDGPENRYMPHALITYVNFWQSSGPNSPKSFGEFSAPDWASFGSCK
jgi:hypothetical protein